MSKERLRYLFFQHYRMTASPDEREELAALIRSDEYHDELKQCILEVLKKEKGDYKLSEDTANQILSSILTESSETSAHHSLYETDSRGHLPSGKPKVIRSFSIVSKLVAASLVIAIAISGYYLLYKNTFKEADATNGLTRENDLPPGKDKAYLSLSDGTKIDLEDQKTQKLLNRHGISNDIKNGELTYRTANSTSGYSTLTTPLGGQYKVILPDGSKAWLNAGSVLKFPNTFNQGRRSVEMTGEVYFEIAKDQENPFIVTIKSIGNQKETEVKVLGTHFNISSYADEPQLKTTLLEGSVEIKRESITKRLKPGQQASISQNSKDQEISIKNVDTRAAVAWKDGRFQFNDNIKDIMRQIARWYDVEVQYEGNIENKSFAGSIPRGNNVSEVLRMLEYTGGIRFSVEGRTVIVKSAPI